MRNTRRLLIVVLAALALLAVVTNRATTVIEGNFMLGAGERVADSLIILSGNVNLAPGSSVGGSLYVLCCNVVVGGEVNGSIHVLSGNVHVQQSSVVRGNIAVGSANVNRESEAMVVGTRTAIGAGFWLMLARTFCLLPLLLMAGMMFLITWLWRRRRPTTIRPTTATHV